MRKRCADSTSLSLPKLTVPRGKTQVKTSGVMSIGRIKHNEKEIQAKMQMCTGADVSLAQYFNRKLNTDDGCHWG